MSVATVPSPVAAAPQQIRFPVSNVKQGDPSEIEVTSMDALLRSFCATGRNRWQPPGGLPFVLDQGASSHDPSSAVCDMYSNGFVSAVAVAFDQHLPLVLKPEHFWLLIIQGIAVHVNQNIADLRSKFVTFQGKQVLHVEIDFPVDPLAKNDWASVIDSFEKQIRASTVPGVVELLSPQFSTTTDTERLASIVTVMDMCQSMFQYECGTCCGFPHISLLGTKEDWVKLFETSAQVIATTCKDDFATKWLNALAPVFRNMRETIESDGQVVNAAFWEAMCKKNGIRGSGGYDWLDGWYNVFMPYDGFEKLNRFAFMDRSYDKKKEQEEAKGVAAVEKDQHLDEDQEEDEDFEEYERPTQEGLTPERLPKGLSSAPVHWVDKELQLRFYSGFLGAKYDAALGGVTPIVGWFITREEKEEKP